MASPRNAVPLLLKPTSDWWELWNFPQKLFDQNFAEGLSAEDFLPTSTSPVYFRRLFSRQASSNSGGGKSPAISGPSTPGISEVINDKNQFQVMLDVAHFTPNEISVKTLDGNTLVIEGQHEEKQDDHGYVSRQFKRKYMLPKDVQVDQLASSLSPEGVLIVVGPKKALEGPKNVEKVVPITVGAPPMVPTAVPNSYAEAIGKPAAAAAATPKPKEPEKKPEPVKVPVEVKKPVEATKETEKKPEPAQPAKKVEVKDDEEPDFFAFLSEKKSADPPKETQKKTAEEPKKAESPKKVDKPKETEKKPEPPKPVVEKEAEKTEPAKPVEKKPESPPKGDKKAGTPKKQEQPKKISPPKSEEKKSDVPKEEAKPKEPEPAKVAPAPPTAPAPVPTPAPAPVTTPSPAAAAQAVQASAPPTPPAPAAPAQLVSQATCPIAVPQPPPSGIPSPIDLLGGLPVTASPPPTSPPIAHLQANARQSSPKPHKSPKSPKPNKQQIKQPKHH